MPFLQRHLQQTLVAANLEHQHTLAESRSHGPDFNRLAGALDNARVGLREKSPASHLLGVRAVYPGGAFPLGITAGDEGDGTSFLEAYRYEKGEAQVKLLNLRGGGAGDSGERGVNLGGHNPNEDFKFWVKCEHELEAQDGEDGGVTLSAEGTDIEGGVELAKEPSRADEAVGFSQEFECYKEDEDIYKGYIEILKVPANKWRNVKLSAKNLYQHHHQRGRVAPFVKSGYEADGEDEDSINSLDAPDNGQDCEDGGVNLLDGNSGKGATLSKGYAAYDVQGQGEKFQSQSEDQDLDDGGVHLPEGQGIEHGEVEFFNEPWGEDEGVKLPLEFEYEKEGGDGHQDNLELIQETDGNDGDGDQSEMNSPQQQHKNLYRREVEGATFLQGNYGARPSPAYLKLLAHLLV